MNTQLCIKEHIFFASLASVSTLFKRFGIIVEIMYIKANYIPRVLLNEQHNRFKI